MADPNPSRLDPDLARLALLAEASNALTASLDGTAALQRVAELVVPGHADWCVIDLLEPGGVLVRRALASSDRRTGELLTEVARRFPLTMDSGHPIIEVTRSGRPHVRTEITENVRAGFATGAEHLRLLRELGTMSRMTAPLVARGAPLGALTMGITTSGRRYQESDLELIENLARRVAMAVDNARLYQEAQSARQRSEESLALLDALLQNAPIGLAFLDPELRYVRVNNALAAINGVPVEEHIGRTGQDLMPDLDPPVTLDLHRVLETDEPILDREVSGETPAAPGETRSWLASYYPVRASDGRTLGLGMIVNEITERRRAEAALRDGTARIRMLADAAPVLIWLSGADGQRLFFNRPWLEFTGRTLEEEVGSGWSAGIHPEDQAACLAAYHAAVQAGDMFRIEYRLRRHDGAYRWMLDTGVPRLVPERGMQVYVGSCIDITERRQAEEERAALLEREQAARAEAESASRSKDEFLSTVSHELRTPLTPMLAWSQMLRGGRLDAAAADRALATIERSAKAQARLIDDLLDISRVMTGKLRLEVQPLDPATVVRAALEALRPAAIAKGVRLEEQLDADAGLVLADPDRLQQVMWNLLSNAVKFTPAGGRVTVRLERAELDLHISVEDTGIGISPAFLPHVFERFRQADASSTRAYGGLGLGLAIVRYLVELQGGTVSAHSAGEGQGATFLVRLPRLAVGEGVRPALVEPASMSLVLPLAGVRVLVVDDDEDARAWMSFALEQAGAGVIAVASAAAAYVALESAPVDVVVSDIAMPGEDGYALMRNLRTRGGDLGRVPAVALTAFAGSQDRDRALAAGYQLHLSKPIEPDALVDVVARLAGGRTRP